VIAVVALCAIALVVAVLVASGAGGSGGGYSVRAIFDDAANIIPGEDVKIDGVKVGVVGAVTPTPTQKAAVVLHIESPGFQNFRSDATCTIEPEALIGEKFVNCLPTQPRPEGTPPPPPLRQIRVGEGAGQYLLPVTNTSSPVDTDLLNDINRLPERQRFTIIINELGAGLAGRGSDLNVVIRRANPALRELDKILGILARQNKLLAKLAVDSDTALEPVAKVKEAVSNFIVQSDTVARASANQRGALAQNLADFPPFLEQLGPAMERFERFADQTIPTFTALYSAAPGINKLFTNIAPFSKSSTAFFTSLAKTTKVSGPALVALQPLLAQAKKTGAAAYPFSSSLSELFTSLRDTGGLERILDFIFLGSGSTNGYDALGHFLRTEGLGTICLTYAITSVSGCSAKLFSSNGVSSGESSSASASASSASLAKATPASIAKSGPVSVTMARTLAVLQGATPAQAIAKYPGSATGAAALTGAGGQAAGEGATSSQPVGGSSSGTTYYSPSTEAGEPGGMLLNYLLGD
jgi:phospholipid/cholesterol/gamma-HCH transport system substrate-binding protein